MSSQKIMMKSFSDPTNTMYNLHNNPKPLVPVIRHEAGINYKELEQSQLMSILFPQKIKLEMQDLSD